MNARALRRRNFMVLLYLAGNVCVPGADAPLFAQGPRNYPAVYPHVESSSQYRVTNRRFVSHILYELIENRQCVTIIATHPPPWNFHADSYALHYECGSKAACLDALKKLDEWLRGGYNLGLRLRGSWIQEIVYYPPG